MSVFKVQEHLVQASYIREYARSLADEHDDDLRVAVKQYTPLDNPAPHDGDLTIIGAHANAFPKELYEPLWDELYHRMKDLGHRVRNIFIMDVAHQGHSGVLNATKLGNDPSWMDVARDLLMVVNHFRTEIKHPIVGIGHSLGGNSLVNLAHLHPRLFTSLVLIDPVIARNQQVGAFIPGAVSSVRRDRWASRAAAEESFKKSKFYQAWDRRVLDLWFKFGLRERPKVIGTTNNATPATSMDAPFDDPPVVLTTTKHHEVFTFVRPGIAVQDWPAPYRQSSLPLHVTHPDLTPENGPEGPFYRPEVHTAFRNLATLRPSVLYVFAGKSNLSNEELNADKLAVTGTGPGGSGGVKSGRVKSVMLKDAGHLVPFEDVSGVAAQCVAWIVPELARYNQETALVRREWDRVPRDEKAVLSESVLKGLAPFLPKRTSRQPEQTKTSKI